MKLSLAAVLVLVAGALAAAALGATRAAAETARISRVVDGDTVVLDNGARVRLLQIDAPEIGSGECYSRRSTKELRRLLPSGAPVRLLADARLDRIDRYGRLLRYVIRGSTNVNLALVARGAATVWFYGGVRGRFAGALLTAARRARTAGRGLWGACRTVWDPYSPATTEPRTTRPGSSGRAKCDPSYPTVCIPPPPPDLDCADVPYRNFPVRPPDPHHFDGDHDGRGCEG